MLDDAYFISGSWDEWNRRLTLEDKTYMKQIQRRPDFIRRGKRFEDDLRSKEFALVCPKHDALGWENIPDRAKTWIKEVVWAGELVDSELNSTLPPFEERMKK